MERAFRQLGILVDFKTNLRLVQAHRAILDAIIAQLSLRDDQKKRIVDRVTDFSFYDRDSINDALKGFYSEMGTTTLVSHDAIDSIQCSFANHMGATFDKSSVLDSCNIDLLCAYLDDSPSLVKGLVCHSVGNERFNLILSKLSSTDVLNYFIDFNFVLPVSRNYLMTFSKFIFSKITFQRTLSLEQEKFHRLVSVIELMDSRIYDSLVKKHPEFELFKLVEPYCLSLTDINLFSQEDQKLILDTLYDQELLIPFFKNLESDLVNQLSLSFTQRKQSMIREKLSVYDAQDSALDTIKVDVITVIRSLQKKGVIASEIKNILTLDSVAFQLNVLGTDRIRNKINNIGIDVLGDSESQQ